MRPIYTLLFTLATIVAVSQPTASESDHVYALDVSIGSCQSPVSSSSSSDISANIITSYLPMSCASGYLLPSYSAIWLSVVAPDSGKLSFKTGRSSTARGNVHTTLYSKNQNDEYTEVLCQGSQLSAVTASNLTPGQTYYLGLADLDDHRYGGSGGIERGFYACAWDPESLSHSVKEEAAFSYNNPFGNRLAVESPYQIQTLQVFDLMGKEVLHKTPNQHKLTLDTYTLTPGAYLLRVKTTEGQQTVKLLKK
ncbi:MAG: T9SS type A sorting domain-containing protein [Flavobacteriaceae bacterium]